MKRVFLIVLDSCGAGAMPDSEKFGDVGVHTLKSCATSDKLHIPNLVKLGIGNIDGQEFLGKAEILADDLRCPNEPTWKNWGVRRWGHDPTLHSL